LRQQTLQSAVWADSIKQFTNSSQKVLLTCTSELQVYCHLQVDLRVKLQVNVFTNEFISAFKCSSVLCLTVILNSNFKGFRQ
jgi:hypothetical protein